MLLLKKAIYRMFFSPSFSRHPGYGLMRCATETFEEVVPGALIAAFDRPEILSRRG